jgi:hypothetical protein
MAAIKRYFNYKNYLHYIFKRMEKRKLARKFSITEPQFIITGLPRTGTTLVYQYIVHRLHVAYFTNKTGEYYHTPCTVTWLSRLFFRPYKSDFSSHYGKVSGNMGPREAGAFWLRFFDINSYTDFQPPQKQNPFEDIDTLRKSVHCIQDIFNGAPFVNKNVKHILRLDVLKRIFPRSVFIIVQRDFLDAALSILEGRKRNLDDPDSWWSARPPSYEALKTLPYPDQVAHQVHDLNQKLQEDLGRISADRVIRLDFRDFCENPDAIITEIKKRCPAVKYKNPEVETFDYRKRQPDCPEEEELARKIEQLF